MVIDQRVETTLNAEVHMRFISIPVVWLSLILSELGSLLLKSSELVTSY